MKLQYESKRGYACFSLKKIINFYPEAVFKMQPLGFCMTLSEGSLKQSDAKNNLIVHLILPLR